MKQWLAENTNPERLRGSLADVIPGADVFIGVSAATFLGVEDLKKMAPRPIVFALANPDPEIDPDLAVPYAAVVATGRSDYPNQINNVLCFPGFFRGMLDVRACRVVDAMKIAAAGAIAGVIARARSHARLHCPQRLRPSRGHCGGEGGIARARSRPGSRGGSTSRRSTSRREAAVPSPSGRGHSTR